MKVVAIVQARMTSARLPGKILTPVSGEPMLVHELRRIKACKQINDVCIATTINSDDDPVVRLADSEGVRWFRGSEHDVLSRYQEAALEARADVIARLTADCPLLDPVETDRVVSALLGAPRGVDYASNVLERTFPRGLDSEALFTDVLMRIARLGTSSSAREHVTWFIHTERPELFLMESVRGVQDDSDLRWTVDTSDDLALVTHLYEALDLAATPRPYSEVVTYMRSHPHLLRLNQFVQQKES